MALKEYRAKRRFDVTAEPAGKQKPAAKRRKALIFVVQKHRATALHYDFRLEWNGVLLSWAVPKGPSLDPTVKRLAMEVEDHPIEYAKFEGIIPEGEYGGGTVMVWDSGTWTPESPDVDAALKKGDLKGAVNAYKGALAIKGKENDKGALAGKESAEKQGYTLHLGKGAAALKKKGYDYRYVFAMDARHVDPRVVKQTLPAALEWLWRDYPKQ